jgi:hypothetical protein
MSFTIKNYGQASTRKLLKLQKLALENDIELIITGYIEDINFNSIPLEDFLKEPTKSIKNLTENQKSEKKK